MQSSPVTGKLYAWFDRCMLYVLRYAVYYAVNATHDPEKLKW